jgi:predicted nucleic acid-binding protein
VKLLLDTCVLSELQKPGGSPAVHAFFAIAPSKSLFLSVISLGEIAKGIALLPDGEKKHVLGAWAAGLSGQFADRILPLDQATAELWGELSAAGKKRGHTIHVPDGQIAATAIRHGLHVATRNMEDFMRTGAMVINPWLTPLGTLQ